MEFVEINGFTVTDGGHNFRRPTCKELATSSRSNQIYFDSRADTKRLTPLEMALLYNEAQGVLASNEFPPAARAMTWGSLSGAALGALGFLVSPFTGIAGLAAGALGGSLIGYSRHRNEPRNNVDAAGGLVHSKKNQLLQLEDYLEHSLKKSVSRTDLRDGYSQSVRVTPRDGWKHGYARCEEVYCMTLPYAVSESGILTADDTCEFATFRLSVVNAVPQLLECYIEDHWSGGVPVIDYAPVHPDPVQVVVGAPKMGGGMLPFFVEKGLFEAFAESVKNYVTFDYVAIPLRTGSLTEAL